MRISELAARTGVAPRLLRYYEEQGLVTPDRAANGYRSYDEAQVDRVIRIRDLLDAGIPTRIIARLLPCLGGDPVVADADLVATLEEHRDQLTAKIDCLARNRDAIAAYVEEHRRCPCPPDRCASSAS